MDILKLPYEISLWEDKLFWCKVLLKEVTLSKENYEPGLYFSSRAGVGGAPIYELDNDSYVGDKQYYTLTSKFIVNENVEDISIPSDWSNGATATFQFYKEVKICPIGSNDMQSPARCVNPKLTTKVNGDNSLTFTIYHKYYDNFLQKFVDNPYRNYLVNERKIKLRLGTHGNYTWYDFIIKNIQENSDSKAFNYTCKSQFINELSKSGFDIVLDNELENSIGTINELGEEILKDSDWKLKSVAPINQYLEEPLYELKTNKALNYVNLKSGAIGEILEGATIYAFYSDVVNKNETLQFLLPDINGFKTDDNYVIDKEAHDNYELTSVKYEKEGDELPDFADEGSGFCGNYRGQKLIKKVNQVYDSLIDKYVKLYINKDDGQEYRGYTETKYISPSAVSNYVANPNSFTSTAGWNSDSNNIDFHIETSPSLEEVLNNPTESLEFKSYLEFQNKTGAYIMNSGFGENRSRIKELTLDQPFVMRIKYLKEIVGVSEVGFLERDENDYRENSESSYLEKTEQDFKKSFKYLSKIPEVVIAEYKIDDGVYSLTNNILTFSQISVPETNEETPDSNYIYGEAKSAQNISQSEFQNWDFKVGIFIKLEDDDNSFYRIEDFQIFPKETFTKEDKTGICVPGGLVFSEIKTEYIYYKKEDSWKTIEDFVPTYRAYVDSDKFVLKPADNQFEKTATVVAKESNRFNLIQTLCEKFECWSVFDIDRNEETGQIKYGMDCVLDGSAIDIREFTRQQKFVTFSEQAGTTRYTGFRYGVNSKSIQRTVDSANIVTKMIVKDNSNEFAPSGFCTIAQSTYNPTKESFLLNFDYYINQNLLNRNIVYNDLYSNLSGYLGYFRKLRNINENRDQYINTQTGLAKDILNYTSLYTTYKTSYDAALEEKISIEKNILRYTDNDGEIFDDVISDLIEERKDDSQFQSYMASWCRTKIVIFEHEKLYKEAQANLETAQKSYEAINVQLQEMAESKRLLNLQFYKKYSNFIQEGSWIKEDHTDPNLYYFESESTLITSSKPKVTYNINLVDVESLQGYEDYHFEVGDRTYIEDIEFFGWKNGAPYKEEVVISEIINELDAPEKKQIKVQNYKTQFDDLFQRITATTQQLQFSEGKYNRTASTIKDNGTLASDILTKSFEENAIAIRNAKNQSVILDDLGITTTNQSNPSECVRIIGGGVYISKDGGETWTTGISGSGINTSLLTAGIINTNEIQIMSGLTAAFRWDSKGLNAYRPNSNYKDFVRFNQFGMYGIKDSQQDDYTQEEIGRDSIFSLTWDGFTLQQGRVVIGEISEGNYGLQIRDANKNLTLQTYEDGLWLAGQLKITDSIFLGHTGERKETGEELIFNANGKFKVYDNGDTYIEGEINAISGKIGGFAIKNNLLESSNLKLYGKDSVIEAGDIIIDGKNSQLKNKAFINSGSTSGWCVSNGTSYFNDVVVRGKIQSAVFSPGEISALGSVFLARPSSIITSCESQGEGVTKLRVQDPAYFSAGNWCYIGSGYYNIQNTTEDSLIISGDLKEEIVGKPIINFGGQGAVGIGINGSTDSTLVVPNAISVFEFTPPVEDSPAKINTKIILGQIPQELLKGINWSGSYGLYADNVYLKGALIADGESSCAGINTNSSASSINKFKDNSSNIIIWAGATGASNEQIQNANFFVDKNGNLFTNSAKISGAIVADSEIRTSKIIGTGGRPALTIEDAKEGIVFNDPLEKSTVFTVSTDELNYRSRFVVDDSYGLRFDEIIIQENTIKNKEGNTQIVFKEDGLDLKTNQEKIIEIGTDSVEISESITKFYRGEGMEYRFLSNGYDLYIDAGIGDDQVDREY